MNHSPVFITFNNTNQNCDGATNHLDFSRTLLERSWKEISPKKPTRRKERTLQSCTDTTKGGHKNKRWAERETSDRREKTLTERLKKEGGGGDLLPTGNSQRAHFP